MAGRVGSCDALSPALRGEAGAGVACLCSLLFWRWQGPAASVLSLGDSAPKAAQGLGREGLERRRPQAESSHHAFPWLRGVMWPHVS